MSFNASYCMIDLYLNSYSLTLLSPIEFFAVTPNDVVAICFCLFALVSLWLILLMDFVKALFEMDLKNELSV